MVNRILFTLAILASLSCNRELVGELSTQSSYLRIDSILSESHEVQALITPYKRQHDSQMKEQLGIATKELNNDPGRGESVLGNFVADLILDQARERTNKPVHLSVINAHGGLRVPIAKGPVLLENIYEVMPFDNTIMLYQLNADQTIALFNHCARSMRGVIGGAQFKIKQNLAIDILIDDQPLSQEKQYNVAISDYLANGGNGFGMVGEGILLEDLKYLQRDMIIDYIRVQNTLGLEIDAQIDGRMMVIE